MSREGKFNERSGEKGRERKGAVNNGEIQMRGERRQRQTKENGRDV